MARGSVTKAVIPAAGLGTRFLPATKAQPKEMLPVVDKPAIQYVVEEAVRAGKTRSQSAFHKYQKPEKGLWKRILSVHSFLLLKSHSGGSFSPV